MFSLLTSVICLVIHLPNFSSLRMTSFPVSHFSNSRTCLPSQGICAAFKTSFGLVFILIHFNVLNGISLFLACLSQWIFLKWRPSQSINGICKLLGSYSLHQFMVLLAYLRLCQTNVIPVFFKSTYWTMMTQDQRSLIFLPRMHSPYRYSIVRGLYFWLAQEWYFKQITEIYLCIIGHVSFMSVDSIIDKYLTFTLKFTKNSPNHHLQNGLPSRHSHASTH